MSYEYERIATPKVGLRLHLNENTAGCSPKVIAALQGLTRRQAAEYPDYDAANTATANRLGVSADELLLTNGLDEGLLAVSIVALRSPGSVRVQPDLNSSPEAIVVVPAFDMYAACADAAGGRVVEVPLNADFSFPLEAVRRAITPETRLIFLTSPNNPTGLCIPHNDVLEVARSAPNAIVLVDEAYADFAGESLLDDREARVARSLPNLLIGRTFAKAYGLAGLRAGALIGSPGTLGPIRRVVPPYSLNICATVALVAGLEDIDYYNWYLAEVRASKALLYEALDRRQIQYWPSAANFVLARFGEQASEVVEGLKARDVFVRDKSRDPACPGCLRITTGVVEHTKVLVDALEEIL
jgi:histidinol-phosphate aminotransferase